MKKLMTLLIFSMLLVACVKPEPPAPPLVTFPLTVSITGKGDVSPKSAVVPLGESRVLVATAEDPDWAVYSVKSNSTVYEVPFMSTIYSFTITDIRIKQDVSVVFVKKDDLWVSKDRWYLWVYESQYVDGDPWYVQTLSPQEYTDYMVFTLDGKLSKYHSSGVISGGPYYPWTITAGVLKTPGMVYSIKRLDDTMVLEHDVPSPNGHIHARETFKHTPKP